MDAEVYGIKRAIDIIICFTTRLTGYVMLHAFPTYNLYRDGHLHIYECSNIFECKAMFIGLHSRLQKLAELFY